MTPDASACTETRHAAEKIGASSASDAFLTETNAMTNRISRSDLEQLILSKLKSEPACAGVRSIVVSSGETARPGSDWQVVFFDSGTSSTAACRKAIAAIETCLSGRYTVRAHH
jgi:hypothetical protein